MVAYDPAKSRNWKAEARACMRKTQPEYQPAGYQLPFPAGVAVSVRVDAVFSRPKGTYSKRSPKGREAKLTRPDTENVVKAVLDAGTGVLWHDDSQVWQIIAEKHVGAQDEAPFLRLVAEGGDHRP